VQADTTEIIGCALGVPTQIGAVEASAVPAGRQAPQRGEIHDVAVCVAGAGEPGPPGVSCLPSPIKLHDYAAGAMAAFGFVVEHLGRVRGLPAQTMTLNRRLSGFHLNEKQTQYLNGSSVMMDTWPMAADNGTYRTKAAGRRRGLVAWASPTT
jgi:hypothetical protein